MDLSRYYRHINKENSLPYALRVAAGTTRLDNIKIEILKNNIPTKRTFFFLKIGDWENRMIKRSIDHLNEDIRQNLIRLKEPKIYITDRGLIIVKNYLFLTMCNLHYKIN
jgi:hypothetical protein